MRFERSTAREDSMREQYEIGMQLLDHERADPRHLRVAGRDRRPRGVPRRCGTAIHRRVDCGSPACTTLTTRCRDVVGTTCALEEFPPASLIGARRAAGQRGDDRRAGEGARPRLRTAGRGR